MAKPKEINLKKLKILVNDAKAIVMSLHPDYTMSAKNRLLWARVAKTHVNKILEYWSEEDSDALFKTFVDEKGVLHIHTPYSEYRA